MEEQGSTFPPAVDTPVRSDFHQGKCEPNPQELVFGLGGLSSSQLCWAVRIGLFAWVCVRSQLTILELQTTPLPGCCCVHAKSTTRAMGLKGSLEAETGPPIVYPCHTLTSFQKNPGDTQILVFQGIMCCQLGRLC